MVFKNHVHRAGVLVYTIVYLASSASAVFSSSKSTLPPPCDSNIYCYGDLLRTVQLAHLNEDSKFFVDMSLRFSPQQVYANFETLMDDTNNDPTKVQVGEFVALNFKDPGTEFESWMPDDWEDNPSFVNNITDVNYKAWALALHDLWKQLGRKISTAVQDSPDMYSQIFVKHPVVVPGGRFREFYYWDSYWTIDGLLLSGMTSTVKGMLENFLELVQQYGMVPNGGRIYYTRRSQPPYMIPMIKLYVDHTNDMQFIRDNIELMEQELNFWLHNRTTVVSHEGRTFRVAQYNARVDEPRPESYREDYDVAMAVPEANRTQLYVEYKSGAESGWDYSSRWFVNGESNEGSLKDLQVTAIAPVDLNSLICYNARILSDYYSLLGMAGKATELMALHNEWANTINQLLWHEEDGIWYDLNIRTMTPRRFFYLSNIHPLWSGSYSGDASTVVGRVIDYLKGQDVLDYIGGVPTSKKNSGEQWDFPNAWAPLQHLIVMALQNNRQFHEEADSISLQLADKWVRSAWKGYVDVDAMFEKYNVEIVGAPGGGGEYDVQLGFGWTNGVALRFLTHFGDRLSSIPNGASPGITNPSMASVGDQDLTTGGAGVNNWSSAMAVAAPLVSVALSLR